MEEEEREKADQISTHDEEESSLKGVDGMKRVAGEEKELMWAEIKYQVGER